MDCEKKKNLFVLSEQYEKEKVLGTGASCQVFKCKDIKTNCHYALKVFNPWVKEAAIQAEVEAMKTCDHPCILRLIKDITYLPSKYSHPTHALVLELCENGDLMDYLGQEGLLTENLTRYLFHQIVEAIEYLHSQGIAHLDLKPENFLLNSEFKLRLTDFGYSTKTNGLRDLNCFRGTKGYQAPELLERKLFSGFEVDIFAAGVILFSIHTKHGPFRESLNHDPWYRFFYNGTPEKFWEYHEKYNKFSPELKDLLNGIFEADPKKRFSIPEIKNHPWYCGVLPTTQEIKSSFKSQ
eukprot:TRINITY_DN504_c0_g1_i2.p1 TRINITY_DN504_c0_g1~~TRINITY_DN504_c0_g1_i2.p1  ORF type:complete len:295 (+),score=27.77 TRINITY_DN504_c0_g1_i2:138-1022(+)